MMRAGQTVSVDEVDAVNKYYGVYLPHEGKAFICKSNAVSGCGFYECRIVWKFTEGAYLRGYCHQNLRELLFTVHNNGGTIYQFDSLAELAEWFG